MTRPPPGEFVGRVVDALVVVTKHVEMPQTYYIDYVVDVPVAMLRQVCQVQTVAKTVEAPLGQFVGNDRSLRFNLCRAR